MGDKLIEPVMWGGLVAVLIIVAFHLIGCAPRYAKDDPSIFGRPEVLDQIAR